MLEWWVVILLWKWAKAHWLSFWVELVLVSLSSLLLINAGYFGVGWLGLKGPSIAVERTVLCQGNDPGWDEGFSLWLEAWKPRDQHDWEMLLSAGTYSSPPWWQTGLFPTLFFWRFSHPCRRNLSPAPGLPLQADLYNCIYCLLFGYQFSSIAQSCQTLCDPMNRSTPGFPVHHQLPELTQTHVHRVGDAIQPSHPLS